MKEKFYQFIQGRYGQDELSKFILVICGILAAVNLLVHSTVLGVLFALGLVLAYYRILSKNYSKRYEENQKYLFLKSQWKYKWENHIKLREQRKIYHIYRCPYCGQKIRVPKGKGTIIITCPKCKQEFGKRS